MAAIWKVTITKSFGGVTNAYETNTVYSYEFDGELSDPAHRENAAFLVAAEASILASDVLIKDATIKELPQGGLHRPHRSHVPITFNIPGERTGMGDLLPYNVVAGIRRQANVGSPGTLKFRGVLGELDVEVSADGRYSLLPAAAGNAKQKLEQFCVTLAAGLPDGTFVFPHSPERADDENRQITRWVVQGIVFRQMHNEAQGWEDDLEDAVRKLFNVGEGLIRKIIRGHGFNAFNPEHIRALGNLAIKIQYLLRALPPERSSELVFGEIWNGIPIPNLPGLPGFNLPQS